MIELKKNWIHWGWDSMDDNTTTIKIPQIVSTVWVWVSPGRLRSRTLQRPDCHSLELLPLILLSIAPSMYTQPSSTTHFPFGIYSNERTWSMLKSWQIHDVNNEFLLVRGMDPMRCSSWRRSGKSWLGEISNSKKGCKRKTHSSSSLLQALLRSSNTILPLITSTGPCQERTEKTSRSILAPKYFWIK